MSSDILSLVTTCLTVCAQQPERSRRERDGEDVVTGPLWNITVPVSPSLIEGIIDYATHQQVTIHGVTGRLNSIEGTPEGLLVAISGDVWDRGITASMTIAYANDDERKICTKQWLDVKFGKVRLTHLMPIVEPAAYGAKITIGAEFYHPGWFSRLASANLSHFELHHDKVVPVLTSRFKSFVAPDIKFTWKGAA